MKLMKKLRQAKGWSGWELGKRANLHPSQISKFELGRAVPYEGQLNRLAKALGVALERAFTLMQDVDE